MKVLKLLGWVLVALLVVAIAYIGYARTLGNDRVADEIRTNPSGARAQRTLLLTFSDDRMVPVNYLREDGLIYLGVDGPWWRRFEGAGEVVQLEIQGEQLAGLAIVVLDDPERKADVFSRLRPTAPAWLPDALNGKLVVITPNTQ